MNIDPDSPTFRIITDGQLPLRQCLHPEACAKDIDLPAYYCRFIDLRKEFTRYISFVKKNSNPNMPQSITQPASIAEMVKGSFYQTFVAYFYINVWISFIYI